MRNKYILLLIICVIGLVFRMWALDKPFGLWNDEYVAWRISAFEFPEFFKEVFYNCHMPLYYVFLKFWSFIFGDGDYSLRISSVVTGMFCIISMYFLGREYKNEKTGLFCALFTALSGFMIYFSQEVRLYSLIFLVTTWILFFLIKLLNKITLRNFLWYLFFNFLLLITHTIGFVFVFFNLLVISLIIIKRKPELKIMITRAYAILGVLSIPVLVFVGTILTRDSISQNWGFFNLSRIFFVFSDYVTPLQLNLVNAPVNVLSYLKSHNIFNSILFFLCPIGFSCYFIAHASKEKQAALRVLSIIGFGYFAVLILAAMMGKLVLTTKYSVEIYPIIILAIGAGMSATIKNKLGKSIFIMYLLSTLVYLVFAPNAPQKLPREEGHKAPIMLLQAAGIGENDTIIALYHQMYRYEKYMNVQPKNSYDISKDGVAKVLIGDTAGESFLKHHGKDDLREYFKGAPSSEIDARIDEVYKKLKKGEKVAIIIPKQVAFLSSGDLLRIANDDEQYKKAEIIFLAFSFAKIKYINEAVKYCKLVSVNELGTWAVVTFEKL